VHLFFFLRVLRGYGFRVEGTVFREEPFACILPLFLFINYLIKTQGDFFLYLKNFLFAVALGSEIDLVQKPRHKIWKASSPLWISWV
jgi:hypothetical protein